MGRGKSGAPLKQIFTKNLLLLLLQLKGTRRELKWEWIAMTKLKYIFALIMKYVD